MGSLPSISPELSFYTSNEQTAYFCLFFFSEALRGVAAVRFALIGLKAGVNEDLKDLAWALMVSDAWYFQAGVLPFEKVLCGVSLSCNFACVI